MNALIRIENLGFKVTWKLIALGFFGFNGTASLISREELISYLFDCLGRNEGQIENIVSLICEKDNAFKIDSLIESFSAKDISIETIQCRKWKAYILNTLLSTKQNSSFQGLLDLMEFWSSVEELDNCPHVFPDNNQIPLQEYFTDANYQVLLEKNLLWLENEIQNIIQLESDIDSL